MDTINSPITYNIVELRDTIQIYKQLVMKYHYWVGVRISKL